MKNSVDLAQLIEMPVEEAKSLSVEQIVTLLEELTELKNKLKRYDFSVHAMLHGKFADEAAQVRSKTGKDTGTVRLKVSDYVIVADLPKDVDWDQAELKNAAKAIEKMGEPVEQYVSIKLSVSETKYNAWPDSLKTIFAAARTVGTGKPTFKIEKAKL